MSIPNSDNTAPVPVTRQPDWSMGVESVYAHATALFVSRTGHEQRNRTRTLAKAKISYTVSGLTLAEALQVMTAAEVEARRLCIVPFWGDSTFIIDSTDADECTIGVEPRQDFFAAGQYVYFDDGTTQDFRLIESVNGRILTLAEDVGAPLFGAATRIYPCRRCRRMSSDEMLRRDDLISHALTLEYESVE